MKLLEYNGSIIRSNPWIGCQKVSPGCDHCHAETQNKFRKWNGGTWGPHAPRKRTSDANWKLPYKWGVQAFELRERRRVFCASLADVFDNQAPDGAREDLFHANSHNSNARLVAVDQRPQGIRKVLPGDWGNGYDNVWLGTTAEDQKYYDSRWAILKDPAKVRFISYEPALGPLDITGRWGRYLTGSFVAASGAQARYMKPQWAYDLRRSMPTLERQFLSETNDRRQEVRFRTTCWFASFQNRAVGWLLV